MSGFFDETKFYEQSIIQLFVEMGYSNIHGIDVERDLKSPVCEKDLKQSLMRLNPKLPLNAIEKAYERLLNLDVGSLLDRNIQFTDFLQNGLPISYYDKSEQKHVLVRLVDYENIENNHFVIADQWTIIEKANRRPDLIVFVNGLPLVVIELKSPSREITSVDDAYLQIQNYKHDIPSLFQYNSFCVISDQLTTRAGTITAGMDRFKEWKTENGDYENTQVATFDVFFKGIFDKSRFLDIIKNFICFSYEDKGPAKIMAGYHQYYAVKKALESTKKAIGGDGKAGVFWHTQGSGKSLSMVFYAHLLQSVVQAPTIVVITDRVDLDSQLYSQFCKCSRFLRQTPAHAQKRKLSEQDLAYNNASKDKSKNVVGLKDWLLERKMHGIIFTTMQKFEESAEALSERENIIVMVDEAHRSQYGLQEEVKYVEKDGQVSVKTVVGTARIIRNCLPKATYIAFTGTPIALKDRSTREVFGDYIDIYDMTQAVEDGATRPVYYENRVIKLKLKKELLESIDAEYKRLIDDEEASEDIVARSKKDMGNMEAILGSDETIESLVNDILDHYEGSREGLLTGKAMIVAYSRNIAFKIYERILKLRPNWDQKVRIVMTESNQDPVEWRTHTGNKQYRQELAQRFKDNEDPFKIAIVVDMWLTGFDIPSLATMYVYKLMTGHNLMQAIARVNRVFKDKEGGLVVDYVGIASALKQAMKDYTKRDQRKFVDHDISKKAKSLVDEKLKSCRDMFHGFDLSKHNSPIELERAKTVSGALNFIISPKKQKEKEIFLRDSFALRQALSMCASIVDKAIRFEAAFFDCIRVLINRLTLTPPSPDKKTLKQVNEHIGNMIQQAVKSEGVESLFSDIEKSFSLFDSVFLEKVAAMKERNIAVELLKKLIEGQIKISQRTNLTMAEDFSAKLQKCLNGYINGQITNQEVIEELMKMAEQIKRLKNRGASLGLSEEEMAFYDALTRPQAVRDFYHNDELVKLTQELTKELRSKKTIDWSLRRSARAKMRMIVKKLLKIYKYPPEGEEEALNTVLQQCELWSDNQMLEPDVLY